MNRGLGANTQKDEAQPNTIVTRPLLAYFVAPLPLTKCQRPPKSILSVCHLKEYVHNELRN